MNTEDVRIIPNEVIKEVAGVDLDGIFVLSQDGKVLGVNQRIAPNCKQIDKNDRTYRNAEKAYVELPIKGTNPKTGKSYKTGKKCVRLYELLMRVWPEEYGDEESALDRVRQLATGQNEGRYEKRKHVIEQSEQAAESDDHENEDASDEALEDDLDIDEENEQEARDQVDAEDGKDFSDETEKDDERQDDEDDHDFGEHGVGVDEKEGLSQEQADQELDEKLEHDDKEHGEDEFSF